LRGTYLAIEILLGSSTMHFQVTELAAQSGGIAVQQLISIYVGKVLSLGTPFKPLLAAMRPHFFAKSQKLIVLMVYNFCLSGMIASKMLEKVFMLQGNVPCACKVYMLLVLDKCEMSPLHLAGKGVKDVEVQMMHTQWGFITQTCLIRNIIILSQKMVKSDPIVEEERYKSRWYLLDSSDRSVQNRRSSRIKETATLSPKHSLSVFR
jgi:hypothetical protein